MPEPLRGKVAIVTGAASGIGRAVALGLAQKGAQVALFDLNTAGLEETAKLILGPDRTGAFSLDLGVAAQVEQAFDDALERFGRVDILINCAGVTGAGVALLDVSDETFDRVMAVNLKAPFILMKRAGRRMIEQGGGGRIVNVTSGAAHRARSAPAAYGGSKAALAQLTRTAAAELGPHDINVNAVAPGLTVTPMMIANLGEEALDQAAREGPLANLMHRHSLPEDVANMIVFLCLPESRQVTGQTIHVNAGSMV